MHTQLATATALPLSVASKLTDSQLRIHLQQFEPVATYAFEEHLNLTAWEAAYLDVRTPENLLLFCASMNYLNAWVKRPEQKRQKGRIYARVKGAVGRVLEELLESPLPDVELALVQEEHMNCAYLHVKGWLFSFHCVPETPALTAFKSAQGQVEVHWERRLQPIAPALLEHVLREVEG